MDVTEGESGDEVVGWSAIDAALERIYGDTEPVHWGTVIKWSLGGPDPLDGISVYARSEPVPHWHYVSYGMSELYAKESENPDESGWGFEFTFRLVRAEEDTEPPVWAANFLQNLARYVFNSGNWFDSGHTMKANGPIAAERPDSAIRAMAFVVDPELGEIATPHGKVRFLQVVGLTMGEYEAARAWAAGGVVDALGDRIPLRVTDLDRPSFHDDPEVAAAIRAGIEREGPASDTLLVSTVGWTLGDGGTVVLRLGAVAAPHVARELAAMLPRGRRLAIRGDERAVGFLPAADFGVERVSEDVVELGIPAEAVADLVAAFRPRAGRYPVPALPGLTIEIEPSILRNGYGEETGEVIG